MALFQQNKKKKKKRAEQFITPTERDCLIALQSHCSSVEVLDLNIYEDRDNWELWVIYRSLITNEIHNDTRWTKCPKEIIDWRGQVIRNSKWRTLQIFFGEVTMNPANKKRIYGHMREADKIMEQIESVGRDE